MAEYDHHGNVIPEPKFSREQLADKVHPWTRSFRKTKEVKDWLDKKDRSSYGFDSYGNPSYGPNYWQDQQSHRVEGWDDVDAAAAHMDDPGWERMEFPTRLDDSR